VAIVASAKKCHTNEKSIFRTEGAVVVKKKGWGLLLHLLQAHLHSQNKRRKNFNRKSFYLLVSARKSAAGETSSLVRGQKNIKVALSGSCASGVKTP